MFVLSNLWGNDTNLGGLQGHVFGNLYGKIKHGEIILHIYVGYRRGKMNFVFGGVKDWAPDTYGHPRAPKLWWSVRKPPFAKWAARHPDGRDYLAKERSGFFI